MGIRFGSIGTGLPKDIVQKIIQAERRPIEGLEKQKAKQQEKLQLVNQIAQLTNDISSSIKELSTYRDFRLLRADIGREDLLGVSLDHMKANPGEYQIEIPLLSQKSSAMSNGFPDPDESEVGVGWLSYELPESEENPDGLEKEIWIGSGSNTLRQLASKINNTPELGLQASVVNDGTFLEKPWRLIIARTKSGDAQKIDWPNFYFTNGDEDFYLEETRDAHDAIIKIDGFKIEVPENRAAELLPGVSLDLMKAEPGTEFTLSIKEDIPKIADKVQALIEKINQVLSFVINQNKLDAESDTSRTLGGDSTIQTLESRFRNIILAPVMTEFGMSRLNQVGVEFQRNGLLEFNRDRFEVIAAEDFEKIADLFVGHYNYEQGREIPGFINKLSEAVTGFSRPPDGILPSRRAGVQRRIRVIEDNIANKERNLERREKALREKFARLETTMNQLKQQGAGLSALGSGSNLITDLGPAQSKGPA